MISLTISRIPPSPNVLRRKYRNPYAYKKLRTAFEYELLCAVGAHHRQFLKDQARKAGRLWVQITVYHSRLYDFDNLQGSQKPVLDALVNIGFLGGDDANALDLHWVAQVKCPRKEQKMVVKIGVVD